MHSESCAILQSKYYTEKLGIHKHDAAGRRRVAASFIEGLHWVLEYYYRGVASWTWFFPYHFAPMISDMTDIQEFDVAFQLGQPFLPFQQLLGVLPSASFKLLPEPFQVGLDCPLTEAFVFQLGRLMLLEFFQISYYSGYHLAFHSRQPCLPFGRPPESFLVSYRGNHLACHSRQPFLPVEEPTGIAA